MAVQFPSYKEHFNRNLASGLGILESVNVLILIKHLGHPLVLSVPFQGTCTALGVRMWSWCAAPPTSCVPSGQDPSTDKRCECRRADIAGLQLACACCVVYRTCEGSCEELMLSPAYCRLLSVSYSPIFALIRLFPAAPAASFPRRHPPARLDVSWTRRTRCWWRRRA